MKTTVIGIDPGYERLGIAVVEKENNREKLIFSCCFKTSKDLSHPERIRKVAEEIAKVAEKYQPEILAIETLFFSKNTKTALKVAETRGAILSEVVRLGLTICEMSPGEIKMSITGSGAADKKSMMKMVDLILGMNRETKGKKLDDEYDAIATALAYFALEKSGRFAK